MSATKPHILLFVEDPGAANYVQYLPNKIAHSGQLCTLMADGAARKFLSDRGILYEPRDKRISARRILEKWRPDILMFGTSSNPDTYAFHLQTAAREMDITTVGIVDTLSHAEFRFRGGSNNPIHYAPDWIIVPDQPTMQAFEELGIPAGNIRLCGHPHYDHVIRASEDWEMGHREIFRNKYFPGISKERIIFVFASVPFTGIDPQLYKYTPDFTLKGRGEKRVEPEVVIEEFIDTVNTLKPKPYLVIRIHPKQKPEDFSRYLEEFDSVSSGGSALELLFAADLIAGLPTMLLVEAVLLGKKTLSISANPKRKPTLPTILMGITTEVSTQQQLRTFLNDQLDNALMPIQTNFTDQFVFNANRKIVEFVEDIYQIKNNSSGNRITEDL